MKDSILVAFKLKQPPYLFLSFYSPEMSPPFYAEEEVMVLSMPSSE
jgi:hypothetical protein